MPAKKSGGASAAAGGDDKSKEKKGGTSVKVRSFSYLISAMPAFIILKITNR